MSITISVVTTANRQLRFAQQDEGLINGFLRTLSASVQLFSTRSLIIGSSDQTQILNPSSITRIEIETSRDISQFLPRQPSISHLTLTAIGAGGQETGPGADALGAGQIDFFFQGGDLLQTWVQVTQAKDQTERIMVLTKLFENPFILYTLPQGGVGLMNPATMTRALVKTGGLALPSNAWHLEPA